MRFFGASGHALGRMLTPQEAQALLARFERAAREAAGTQPAPASGRRVSLDGRRADGRCVAGLERAEGAVATLPNQSGPVRSG
jgi:hypothetical protein